MCRNWKRAAALGLTVLLGCMLPMSTMLAAEDDVETEAESVSENDVSEGNVPDEEDDPGEETAGAEEGTDTGDENTSDDGSADLTQMAGILAMAETEPDVVPNGAEASESTDAPEIVITRGGADKTCSLGGEIVFEYTNNSWGATFEVSVGPSDQEISFFYCQDKVKDMKAEAKTEEQMDSLYWQKVTSPVSVGPLNDGCYVIYVKVITDAKTYYARSGGIVVDTVKPVIKGVEAGKSYPAGTPFQVEDDNLEHVLVNGQTAALENGSYKVTANGTFCVIRAKDKAGNEEICSINVFGNETPEPKPEEPKPEEPGTGPETPDDSNVISRSGEYALKAGVKYHLADGKWKLAGDSSVYQGGNDFYVNADGNYTFSK